MEKIPTIEDGEHRSYGAGISDKVVDDGDELDDSGEMLGNPY